ncbi:gamma-glutamyltransferase [Sandaracinobacteroides saxicola]|uniref:Glutathione hydrolase proenzyme n=1 Tax=Sandaracinobacteroides saxicola TaxID=2759707 RepID=A0A7G5IER9_9SPHN|nr:gamma-glutamyltransferase [Sandaracinobacteroides saxicola]QMW21861.1 gamma-glutamyltransferase [Sandaracinobacteroides saxicola]
MLKPLAIMLLAVLGSTVAAGDRANNPPWQGRSPVIAQHGMAATAQPLATQVALDILKAGGSAVDAAIAANAMLGLVEPVGNGIGGDLFALVWDPKTRKLHGLDASGAAPAATDVAALRRQFGGKGPIGPAGTAAITVPGAVAGWHVLHQQFGVLPLKQLLAPAVGYARNGFPVSPLIAEQWARNIRLLTARRADIPAFDNALALYAPGGSTPAAGAMFTNPDLARTLEAIGKGGAKAFYTGPIARDIAAFMAANNAPMRETDLAAMRAEWVEPISATYRGYTVWQMPPATQGLATLQMLRLIERFDIAKMGFGSADAVHVMVEAKKLAFADRARFLADPRVVKVPVAALLSDAYTAKRAALIRMDRALPADVQPGDPAERSDTTYLTVADRNGMMISLIQSNYRGMGSGVVASRSPKNGGGTLGFMFQNRGAQFSLDATAANVIAPGKRPFHTIIPGFVTKDGMPFLSLGVMGGSMQPQGQVQVITNIIDFGMDVQAAGDAPRWRHIGGPDPGDGAEPPALFLERDFTPETRAALAARGHVLKSGTDDVGGYQAIRWDAKNRVYWGASEMRKDGQAAGY